MCTQGEHDTMDCQDWAPAVLHKARPKGGASASASDGSAVKVVQSRRPSVPTHAPLNLLKVEAAEDAISLPTVSHGLAMSIQRARLDKKLTQKQLAALVNEKPTVINDYESGRAVPVQATLTKLSRALGVTLKK
jgi:putative transcription factor